MKTGDPQHRELLNQAARFAPTCSICRRHCETAAGTVLHSNIRTANLYSHLVAGHNVVFSARKKWWQFWK